MPEPLGPAVGWGVLHLFCHVGEPAGSGGRAEPAGSGGRAEPAGSGGRAEPDGSGGRAEPLVDVEAVVSAVKECQADDHQVVAFAVLGHKADLGFLALGPNLWRLRRLQRDLQTAGLRVTSSYVSLTETSEYAKDLPPEMVAPRLYPQQLPPAGMRAVCFYGMSKRRDGDANWYATPFEDRKRMMYEHGTSGRAFRGRVVQLVTGSTGVDDWEWGVTLFAGDPADLKEVVYRLRFDEASARFGAFGPFYTGLVAEVEEVMFEVAGRPEG